MYSLTVMTSVDSAGPFLAATVSASWKSIALPPIRRRGRSRHPADVACFGQVYACRRTESTPELPRFAEFPPWGEPAPTHGPAAARHAAGAGGSGERAVACRRQLVLHRTEDLRVGIAEGLDALTLELGGDP